MKKTAWLGVPIALLLGLGSVSPQVSSKRPTKHPVSSRLTQAEGAWKPFFEEFREIIKRRNLKRLKETMSEDFSYPCALNGHFNPQATDEDGHRDFEIRKFSDPNCGDRGWKILDEITSKGASSILRRGASVTAIGEIKTISKIVPGCWIKFPCTETCGSDNALFEFRGDRWFFVQMSFCETE
jgi:hypothetical protein